MSVYAQEYGQFFNSNNGDRTYNADSMETFMKPFFESGVFANCLQVTAQSTPSMSLNVAAGYAYLDGKTAYWPVTNSVTLANASGVYNRIDTVVLRRDDTNRRISIEVVTGTASASPQPTAPTRNGDIFELVLAQIYVGVGVTEITQANITDKRPDTDVCGYVMCTIETPDFSELYAQFEEQAAEAIESGTDDFMTWYDHMKDQLDEDAAGHLQLEIDAITDEIGDTALPTTAQTLTGGIAENNQEAQDLKDAIGIVINGNTAARSVAPGQYVIVRNSTITGITNGLYKYSGSTTKTAGNSFTSSELTAEPEGGLNALNGNIATLENKVNTFSNRTLLLNATTEGQHTLNDLLTNYRYVLMILRDTSQSACHGSNFIPVGLFKEYNSVNFACGISAYNNGRIYTYVNYVSNNNKVNVQLSSGYSVLIYGIK